MKKFLITFAAASGLAPAHRKQPIRPIALNTRVSRGPRSPSPVDAGLLQGFW